MTSRLRLVFAAIFVSQVLLAGSAAQANLYEAPRIGVGGCSNTEDFLANYARYSTTDNVWHENLDLGGGHLAVWADVSGNGAPYWSGFQNNLETLGAHALWFQICLRAPWTSSRGMTSDQQLLLTEVVEHARLLTSPTLEVYVSPLNSYQVFSCNATGPYGVSNSIELADWAAASGLALRGPDLGPLTPEMVSADGCHPSTAGKALGGQQIAAFFDLVSTNPVAIYWCVDGTVQAVPNGKPAGGYVAGPYASSSEAGSDPGCVSPRISTSTDPIYVGMVVTFTDFYIGDHRRSWDMGNGDTFRTSTPALEYAYDASGTYTVVLETRDDSAGRVILTRTITVLVKAR
jgi:hypothetical protein